MTKLTSYTRNMLEYLWDCDAMTARYGDVHKASKATLRGFPLVLNRALDSNFVVRTDARDSALALSFGGMTALKRHYTELYNDRPCDAYRSKMEKYARVPSRAEVAA